MTRKIIWLFLSFLMVLSLVLVSCGTKTTSTTIPTTTETTTPTTTTTPKTTPTTKPATITGKWWDKFGVPQYGGTINMRIDRDVSDWSQLTQGSGNQLEVLWSEGLGMGDMALDREVWPFNTSYNPTPYRVGDLAESWEQPDLQTIIFHIRKGVYWQDKPPTNGRELTAYDIEFNFHRVLGLGSGYTTPSAYYVKPQYQEIASVTATDKYTLVFKAKQSTITMLDTVLILATKTNVPPELVKQYGEAADNNWRYVVSLGPFIVYDYTSGSALTLKKNPNYWGYDPRHPENRLPYVDDMKLLIIPNLATAVAGLRTGKIDLVDNVDWVTAKSLAETNPTLMQTALPYHGMGICMRVDKAPYTDIRVRKAMQMAIDLPRIAKAYYGGLVEGVPCGPIGPAIKGYYTPFDQWPADIKAEYSYNPEGAKKLLAEAGYPNGFKTDIAAADNWDLDLLQIAKSYFAQIGVNAQIQVKDFTSHRAFVRAFKYDAMCYDDRSSAQLYDPLTGISKFLSTGVSNYSCNKDPVYDAMVDKAYASLDQADQQRLIIEANDYAITQHWVVSLPPTLTVTVYQPWLKGYSGEQLGVFTVRGPLCAGFWIDQGLKKSMGR